ncbi:hypothetical protein PFISCL1PPCAC_3283, partial [Pristionchus fissidentatus]
ARRSIAIFALLSLLTYLVFFNYEYLSLSSLSYLSFFSKSNSSSQLFAYFPHEINCDRVFSGDLEYTKSIALHRLKLNNDTLDMDCESIQARFSAAPSLSEPYSIAYGKIVYKDYQFLEQQMWNSYTSANWYCFSIDSKSSDVFRSQFHQLAKCLPNVLISNVSRNVKSDGVNQNYAHLDCMKTLEKKPFEYIFLLQNHDILARTHREFAEILKVLEGSTVVDKYHCPTNRCLRSYPKKLGQLGLCPKIFKGEQLTACEDSDFVYMKGGMQVLLPKSASDYIVNQINGTPFIDMFTKKFGGDEQYFPTITATERLKIPGRYSANCGFPRYLRHVVWYKRTRCGSRNLRHGVCVFGLEDLPSLRNVPQFMINKMLPSFDNGAIQCFNELLLKRNLGLISPPDSIESYANGNAARFQREMRRPGFDPAKFVCNEDMNKTTTTAKPISTVTMT